MRVLAVTVAFALAYHAAAFCTLGCQCQGALRLSSYSGSRSNSLCSLKMGAEGHAVKGRRQFLHLSAALALGSITLAGKKESNAAGVDMQPDVEWYRPPSVLDGKYTGLEWTGPKWAKPADEPSISYAEFLTALKAQELEQVDFVGYSGEKVYAYFKKIPTERIRVGEGLPDETTPPPKTAICKECEEYCKPEDKTCSCLTTCGGKKDWNSPIYLAKVIRAWKTPFRYAQKDDGSFGSLGNRARRFMMFEGPMSAGLI